MKDPPRRYADVEQCVEETLRRIGLRVTLGTPLGLGKANHLVNEFFRRAKEDSKIDLHIFTALTLSRPHWKNELERRFLEPLNERIFAGYPELEYIEPLKRGSLPKNIRVTEFYFQPGSFLNSPLAQQNYLSSNYTHVVRDLLDARINVLAQLVGKSEENGERCYSLSCNSDVTLDLVPQVRESKRDGENFELLAQVNPNLPFMYADASVPASYFDAIVDDPKYTFPLFGPPNRPVDTVEYLIALQVTALIKDGGTLQIGIGALEDAVTYLLKLRHQQNELYRSILNDAGTLKRFDHVIEKIGGTGPFEEGLYASSEMLVDGFVDLYRTGILKRRVYDHAALQQLLNDGRISTQVSPAMLDALVESNVISSSLTRHDFTFLQKFGILRPEIEYETGSILLEDGTRLSADLTNKDAKEELIRHCLGNQLKDGHFAHACFFLGPRRFYETLRQMDRSEREQICMTGIGYVNHLYGDEELKRLQRKSARFVNTGLIVTLNGAVASDGFEDGRVLSGVGGQYNFVSMAHELEDGRSILMIRSTKDNGQTRSNIRWTYGHVTIPRHLRDIVITEYGIAALRGRTDEEVIIALVEIADSRFQNDLVETAKRAGKLRKDYRIPDYACSNHPARLEALLKKYRERGLFTSFPFGTDLTEEELVLRKALIVLKQTVERKNPRLTAVRRALAMPKAARPYLERMKLDQPRSFKERLYSRALVYGLAAVDAI
ncbi:MAG TPA: acetyl-CoA hydrolase/transferase C-terminal domain-containing protein [Pyrinomonadaceae bacterium]|jgi:acyl-CoA hydrolase|nr:acetyl-CoA hydrolase/transferase C-terminal domain-containing protein [Pyrinomonadaceae bacterium]